MLPDLPVLALKLRDYALWILPAYLLTIGITSGLNALIARYDPAGYSMASGGKKARSLPAAPSRWLLRRLLGRTSDAGSRAGTATRLWILTTSTAITPPALILTAALNPGLALLRLGGALLLCGLVAALVAGLSGSGRSSPRIPEAAAPPAPAGAAGSSLLGFLRLWWLQIGPLLDQTISPLLVSALLGGLFTAWRPATLLVRWLAQQDLMAVVPMSLATILMPFPAGTDIPLARALQTYDVPLPAVFTLLLGAPLLNWTCLRGIRAEYGRRTLLIFLASGLGAVILLGLLIGVLFGRDAFTY